MASCSTNRWVSTAPYLTLTVTVDSETGSTATLKYVLTYTSQYAAETTVAKSYTITINGSSVASGTYDISGKYAGSPYTIKSGTVNINKTTSAQNIAFGVSFAFNLYWSNKYAGTLSASGSVPVSAKTSYTVTYNANGGSGAPSKQTKWHGTALTLSSSKPTRTGYTFQGWATSSSGTVSYSSGASYTNNANVALYAVWKAITYPVSFNANGGSGAPANQTKTYGVTLKLSSVIPTRLNYNFLGWGVSASATTVTYTAGSNYTSNAAITLYAIWELAYIPPRITNVSVERCDINGNTDLTGREEEGVRGLVTFDWECDHEVDRIDITWESASDETDSGWHYATVPGGVTSGTTREIIGNDNGPSPEKTYSVRIIVGDVMDATTYPTTLNGSAYVMDFKSGGKGVSIGKPAEEDDLFDIAFRTRHLGGIVHPTLEPETDLNDVHIPNTYIGANVSSNNYINCPLVSGTFTLSVEGAGEDGQVKQILTRCSKTEPERFIRFYYQGTWSEWMPDASCVQYLKNITVDVDTYIETGTYFVAASCTIVNGPPGVVNGWLVVLRADSGAFKQLWFRYGTFDTNTNNTYVRTGNATDWSTWKRYSVEPDELFSGSSTETITLSETAANFAYLEIFYTDNNNRAGGYTKINSPNGKTIDLSVIEAGADSITYFRRSSYTISGTKITPNTSVSGFVRISGTTISNTMGTNYVKITKVLGHRA